jgi:hypothetical protein
VAQPDTQQEVTHELCVLYAYHRPCSITHHHYELLRWFNLDVPIVPLIPEPIAGELLPGTIDVSAFESHWNTRHMWSSTDTFIYRWFLNRTITARHYVYLEWDTLCLGSLLEFFAPVTGADIASTHVLRWPDKLAGTTDWQWFKERDTLLPAYRKLATGLVPMAGTIISHDALTEICRRACNSAWWGVFSELRLGTLARLSNLNMVANVNARGLISWAEAYVKMRLDRRCVIIHPVKRVLAPLAGQYTPAAELSEIEGAKWP